MLSNTVQRQKILDSTLEKIGQILVSETAQEKGIEEIFRTGENVQTFTFLAGTLEDGTDVYGSLKLTLHKAGYNLDDEIEKFEGVYAEKQAKKNKQN